MNKKINKIVVALLLTFSMTKDVYGATIYLDRIFDDQQQVIYKDINGETSIQTKIRISDDAETVGYCLDVGANLGSHVYIAKYGESLPEYLNETFNDLKKSTEISKKINQYIHFGYEYNGQDSYKYLLATQKLIWDELYNNGYRQNYWSSNAYFYAGADRIDVSSEMSTIKNNITNYYKTPSMCSSTTKLELAIGETATYEDKSNVLSAYEVNCDEGLKCEVAGNKLKVTATAEGSEQKVTFTKKGTNGGANIIYKNTNEQAVLINSGEFEGISCQLGIDTYENVQTSESKIIFVVTIGIISIIVAYIIFLKKQYLNA